MEKQKTRKKTLIRKYKRLIKKHYNTAPFNEPVIFLIRRTGKVEFHDKATTGRYEYIHSDGNERYAILDNNLLQFDYGKKGFKGYILHEDNPFPLPQEPLLTTQMFNLAQEKLLHDIKKWKAEEYKAKGQFIWKILIGIAIIILAFAFYQILIPEPSSTASVGTTAVRVITGNVTGFS